MFTQRSISLQDALKQNSLPELETFPCPFDADQEQNSALRIVFPEFTCVCPRTGYPDFAAVSLYYKPKLLCIELKSWKLYLNSFRMIGTFHEEVSAHLFQTIAHTLAPSWLMLVGDFFPRGNVDTTIVFEQGQRPACADSILQEYPARCTGFSTAQRKQS